MLGQCNKKEKITHRVKEQIKRVISNTTEIFRMKGDYCRQDCNKLENLEELDTFLDTHNLSNLNQEDTENLNKDP